MVITLLVLLAFTLESFTVQTHVHFFSNRSAGRPESLAASTVVDPTLRDFAKDKKDGVAHCPLCQAVLLDSSYLIPAAAQIHLPFVYALLELIGTVTVSLMSSRSHAWHSRAPPIR